MRVAIVADVYATAFGIAAKFRLDKSTWYHVQSFDGITAASPRPDEDKRLFDEWDVLVQDSIGHRIHDWPEIKDYCDDNGLVLKNAGPSLSGDN